MTKKRVSIASEIDYLFEVAGAPSRPVDHKRIGQAANYLHEKLEKMPAAVPVAPRLVSSSDIAVALGRMRSSERIRALQIAFSFPEILGELTRRGYAATRRADQPPASRPDNTTAPRYRDGRPVVFPEGVPAVIYSGAQASVPHGTSLEWLAIRGVAVGVAPGVIRDDVTSQPDRWTYTCPDGSQAHLIAVAGSQEAWDALTDSEQRARQGRVSRAIMVRLNPPEPVEGPFPFNLGVLTEPPPSPYEEAP